MTLRRILLAVAMLMAAPLSAHAYDLTYQNLLIAAMKLEPAFDYQNAVNGYMQAFRPAIWQQFHDDDFERHNKEVETLEMMKRAAAGFNLNDPIIIHTGLQFGAYDFSQHSFALRPFTESTFFQVNYCCAAGLPNQIKLFFSNPGLLDGIPMEEPAARSFLDRHKQYGNVNRQLNAEISVVLESAKSDHELIGRITKIVIADPMNRNAIVLTVNAPGSGS